ERAHKTRIDESGDQLTLIASSDIAPLYENKGTSGTIAIARRLDVAQARVRLGERGARAALRIGERRHTLMQEGRAAGVTITVPVPVGADIGLPPLALELTTHEDERNWLLQAGACALALLMWMLYLVRRRSQHQTSLDELAI